MDERTSARSDGEEPDDWNARAAELDAATPGASRVVALLIDVIRLAGPHDPELVALLDRHRRDEASIDEVRAQLEQRLDGLRSGGER